MDVTVVVATHGDQKWSDLAHERAIPSIPRTRPVVHVHAHDALLHDARNVALDYVDTEWVCYLDADDELERGFFEAIEAVDADLRAPAVRYVRNGLHWDAKLPRVASHEHDCTAECLPQGNWLVVGTVVRAQMVRDVGGWRDWPCYEDWDLWQRCWLAGATIAPVPRAVYRAYVNHDSRNRGTARTVKEQTHRAIVAANLVPA